MNKTKNDCGEIAAIYEKKRASGLLDVKFLLQNRSEASLSQACSELLALNAAVTAGLAEPLDYGDLNWK